jgi:hypothetical protein
LLGTLEVHAEPPAVEDAVLSSELLARLAARAKIPLVRVPGRLLLALDVLKEGSGGALERCSTGFIASEA